MFSVLLLAAIEKVVNLALATDAITQMGLQPLSGKSMRLIIKDPAIEFDTIFNEDHIRFEPVTVAIFEPKGTDVVTKPDCIVRVENPAKLIQLMGEPTGNLPIEGDYKVLMQVKQLMAGFDPDLIGKLQPIIGLPLASQLSAIFHHVKTSVAMPAKQMFTEMADITACQSKGDSVYDLERNDLKQELLRLRADIEREQARLVAIKEAQAALLQS